MGIDIWVLMGIDFHTKNHPGSGGVARHQSPATSRDSSYTAKLALVRRAAT